MVSLPPMERLLPDSLRIEHLFTESSLYFHKGGPHRQSTSSLTDLLALQRPPHRFALIAPIPV